MFGWPNKISKSAEEGSTVGPKGRQTNYGSTDESTPLMRSVPKPTPQYGTPPSSHQPH